MDVENIINLDIETVKQLSGDAGLSGYLVNNILSVPLDPKNSDYIAVQNWIAQGNTPQ